MLAVCITLLLSGAARAAEEPWYTYWGIGWASNTYPSEVEDVLDLAKDVGFDNVTISLDLLGFYWPLPARSNTLLGFIVNGVGDRYSKGGDWIQINSYLLGLSTMQFFGTEPGAGFFARADLGTAWFNVSNSEDDSENSDLGYGVLLGGGYGIPVTEGTRILLNVNYTLRHAEGDNVNSFGISVGGLF